MWTLCLLSAEAYDSLDPNGNITIKWDIMQWTPDGYVVSSTPTQQLYLFHLHPLGPDLFYWIVQFDLYNICNMANVEVETYITYNKNSTQNLCQQHAMRI